MQEELMRCLEQLDAIDMSGCVTDVAANRKQMVDRTNVKNETNSTPLRTHVSAQFWPLPSPNLFFCKLTSMLFFVQTLLSRSDDVSKGIQEILTKLENFTKGDA